MKKHLKLPTILDLPWISEDTTFSTSPTQFSRIQHLNSLKNKKLVTQINQQLNSMPRSAHITQVGNKRQIMSPNKQSQPITTVPNPIGTQPKARATNSHLLPPTEITSKRLNHLNIQQTKQRTRYTKRSRIITLPFTESKSTKIITSYLDNTFQQMVDKQVQAYQLVARQQLISTRLQQLFNLPAIAHQKTSPTLYGVFIIFILLIMLITHQLLGKIK